MGRPVRLVDGTTVALPDTAANQAAYPQSRGQKAGLGFPICRLVGIICLASGAVLDASLGRFRGKGGDEQTLLRTMLDTLNDQKRGQIYFSKSILGLPRPRFSMRIPATFSTSSTKRGIPVSCPRCNASRMVLISSLEMDCFTNVL